MSKQRGQLALGYCSLGFRNGIQYHDNEGGHLEVKQTKDAARVYHTETMIQEAKPWEPL